MDYMSSIAVNLYTYNTKLYILEDEANDESGECSMSKWI